MKQRLFVTLLLLCCLTAPAGAEWIVIGGVNTSDLALNDPGDGFYVGGGEIRILPGERFDVAWTLEFVRRTASQPMFFDDPNAGPVFGAAEVTPDYVQPAVMLGWRLPLGPLLLRPYGGASIAVKISENWDKPDGSTNRVYSYEDIDVVVSAGATLGWGPVFADVRWSWGLLDQVVSRDYDNTTGWSKADDALAGIEFPSDGDKTSAVQAGLGISF